MDKLQERLREAEQLKKGETARLEQELEALREDRRARVAKLKAEVLALKRTNETLGEFHVLIVVILAT